MQLTWKELDDLQQGLRSGIQSLRHLEQESEVKTQLERQEALWQKLMTFFRTLTSDTIVTIQ